MAARYADANKSKQRESRSRLRVAIRFYHRLAETELRKVWYLATKGMGKSGYNLFLKLNMMIFKPDGKIGDFARLQLTVGRLQKVNHLVVRVDEGDVVSVAWEREEDLPSAGKEDKFMVAVLYADRSKTFPERVCQDEKRILGKDGKATFRLGAVNGERQPICIVFSGKNMGRLIRRANT